MAQSDDLTSFVHDALTRGTSRAEIERVLLEATWSKRQVHDALSSFADVSFPIPVPQPRAYTDAREAFHYGLLFLSLYVSAMNLGGLGFVLVDEAFPPTFTVEPLREAIRSPVSLLVVAVPLFAFVSLVISRDIKADPSRRASEIRNKLTYLTLFVSAGVVLGVLAGLVYTFLGTTPPANVVLKFGIAAVIAGATFWHYLRDARSAGTTTD